MYSLEDIEYKSSVFAHAQDKIKLVKGKETPHIKCAIREKKRACIAVVKENNPTNPYIIVEVEKTKFLGRNFFE